MGVVLLYIIEGDVTNNLLSRRAMLGTLAASPVLAKLSASHSHSMFLALNSVLVHGRVKWPEFPQLAARAGYPGCDVMLTPAMAEGADKTNKLFSELNLLPAVLDLPTDFRKDDAAFEASLPQLEPAAKFAADINCPRMITYIMSSSDTPKAELRKSYKERFTRVAAVLAKHNVRLGLEFLGPLELRTKFKYEFIWQMNEMLEFAKECGPNVGLLLDIWHWHHAGATTDDIINAGRERVVHVHFNDAPKLPPEQIRDNQRLLPGEGVINSVGFLQALQKIGYTDALSIEVFGREDQLTPEEAAKNGLQAGLGVFKKAHVPEGLGKWRLVRGR